MADFVASLERPRRVIIMVGYRWFQAQAIEPLFGAGIGGARLLPGFRPDRGSDTDLVAAVLERAALVGENDR